MSNFDWTNWTKKLSTLVAAASVSVAGISAAVLGYYTSLTPDQQSQWPFWLPAVLALSPGVIAALGPLAVAFRQALWGSDESDKAGA